MLQFNLLQKEVFSHLTQVQISCSAVANCIATSNVRFLFSVYNIVFLCHFVILASISERCLARLQNVCKVLNEHCQLPNAEKVLFELYTRHNNRITETIQGNLVEDATDFAF